MPKKAKKKKADAGPVREPTEFDDFTLEAVESKVTELYAELKETVDKRSYFALERDTVKAFRDRTVVQIEELENLSAKREMELADLMEAHRVELEVDAHKVSGVTLLYK